MNVDATAGTRLYTHPARLLVDPAGDGQPECRVCGHPVVTTGDGVRHADEAVRHVEPAKDDAPAVNAALDVVRSALRILPAEASDADRAQAVVDALYRRGALRRRRGHPPADLTLFG